MREVSLPGADASAVPAIIRSADLPDDLLSTTLVRVETDRLEMNDAGGVFLMRIDGGNRPAWLLLMRCMGGPEPEAAALGAYGRLLEQWLLATTLQASTLLLGRVAGMLFGHDGDHAAAGERALTEVRNTLKLETAYLIVASKTGAVVLEAGRAHSDTVRDSRGVVLTMPVGQEHSLSLSASHGHSHHLTPLERRVVDTVAELFQFWARGLVKTQEAAPERRSVYRRFDEVIERLARHALEREEPVAVIVLTLAEGSAPDAAAKIATGVRSQLRPWDVTGVLGEREIGFLLHDTSKEQAHHVIERVNAFVELGERARVASIGLAARVPGTVGGRAGSSIVQEARKRSRERNVA